LEPVCAPASEFELKRDLVGSQTPPHARNALCTRQQSLDHGRDVIRLRPSHNSHSSFKILASPIAEDRICRNGRSPASIWGLDSKEACQERVRVALVGFRLWGQRPAFESFYIYPLRSN
jgi:hypothetical protein